MSNIAVIDISKNASISRFVIIVNIPPLRESGGGAFIRLQKHGYSTEDADSDRVLTLDTDRRDTPLIGTISFHQPRPTPTCLYLPTMSVTTDLTALPAS